MSDNPHPAHKEILDIIPESLHEVVKPVLKKWDQGVNDRFAEIKEEYAGYEPFIKNNIDPKFVEQAVVLAQQIQNEPEKVLQEINNTWELGYSNETPEPPSNEDDDLFSDDDIMKNPKVKAMADALDKLQNKFEETQSEREEREAQEQFEAEITALAQKAKDDNLPYNENFVIGCMASGMSGDEALKEYHKILGSSAPVGNEDESKNEPPNVMGGDGNSGSGSEAPTFDVSGSKDSVNTFVEDLIKAQNESGQ